MQLPLFPLVLLAAASLAVIAGMFLRITVRPIWAFSYYVAAIVASLAFLFEPLGSNVSPVDVGSHHAFLDDGLASAEMWIVLAIGILSALAILDATNEYESAMNAYGFLLFATAGTAFVVRSNDLVSLGLSLELTRRALDAVTLCINSHDLRQSAGRDDSLFSGWSVSVEVSGYWLGVAILACSTGSTNLDAIREVLTTAFDPQGDRAAIGTASKLILLAVAIVLASLGARMGLVPFDSGQISPRNTSLTTIRPGIREIGLHLAASAVLIRLIGQTFVGLTPALTSMLMSACLINFVAASVLAIRSMGLSTKSVPTSLRSMACLQNSWLVIGLMIASIELQQPEYRWARWGNQSETVAICVLIQVTWLLSQGCLSWILGHLSRSDRDIFYFEDLRGLIFYSPLAAVSLVVASASAIGIPGTLGFLAKWQTLLCGLNIHVKEASSIFTPHSGIRVTLVLAMIATTIVSIVVVRLFREILFELPLARPNATGGRGSLFSGHVAAFLILLLGIVPQMTFLPLRSIGSPRPRSLNEIPPVSGQTITGSERPSQIDRSIIDKTSD